MLIPTVILQRFIEQLITLKMYVAKKELTSKNFLTLTFTIQRQVIYPIEFAFLSVPITTQVVHSLVYYAKLTQNSLIALTTKQSTKMGATMEETLQKQTLLVMNLKK
jgi:hypothetical protein